MVQRTVKLMGRAYTTDGAVTVQLSYNGAEVFNGVVAAETVSILPTPDEATLLPIELAVFETTTDTTGQIPVTVSVTGGALYFAHFTMNYTGFTIERQATDPNIPIDPNVRSTYTRTVTVEPVDFYADPNFNTVESDGVSNLTKNGSPWVWRANVGDLLGNWSYPVEADETIAFDFFVDPAKVVLTSAPPPRSETP
jgi:hypothetical protein